MQSGCGLINIFGNVLVESTDQCHDDTLYYGSVGMNENIHILINSGLSILHLVLDQYLERYFYAIVDKA